MRRSLSFPLVFLVLLSLPLLSVSVKFLVFNLIWAHSHSNFIGRVADVLGEAGHEVVVLSPILHGGISNTTSKLARTIHVPPSEFSSNFQKIQETGHTSMLWNVPQGDPFIFIEPLRNASFYMADACRATLLLPGLLKSLRAEQFDGAFGEYFDACGFGIFHLLGINKFAVVQSTASMDKSEVTGVPTFPSFQPGLLSLYGDEMSIWERLHNARIMHGWDLTLRIIDEGVQRVFDELHSDFPPLRAIVRNASYFFLNTEPLIDFPRLVRQKMVDIGGIALPTEWHPLMEPFASELSLRPHTVFISFGTVMVSHLMPERFKQSIRSLALALPNVTFLWKYEKPEHNVAAGIPNLITHTWLPQTDLLRDPRLSAFVTHGGAGSSYEAVLAGVPTLVIPVMGDQMRNVEMIKRIGVGRILKRDDLADPEKIILALTDVLENDKYRQRTNAVADMVNAQPQSVRERLVSHMEFMARFGPLDQLSHAGRDMSVITFYNLDIFAALIGGVISSIVVVFIMLRKLYVLLICSIARLKHKKE